MSVILNAVLVLFLCANMLVIGYASALYQTQMSEQKRMETARSQVIAIGFSFLTLLILLFRALV